jgi:hypothetical protein
VLSSSKLAELCKYVGTGELSQMNKNSQDLTYGIDFSDIGFDTTFNVGPFYVTIAVFTNIFVKEKPIMPASVWLHMNKTFETFDEGVHFFARDLGDSLANIKMLCSDGDPALRKALKANFTQSSLQYCFNHIRKDISLKVKKLQLDWKYVQEIMGTTDKSYDGMVDMFNRDYLKAVETAEKVWPPKLYKYFMKTKHNVFLQLLLPEARTASGLNVQSGKPPIKTYTNNNESINNAFKVFTGGEYLNMYNILKQIEGWFLNYENKWLECRLGRSTDWTLLPSWYNQFHIDTGAFFQKDSVQSLQFGIFSSQTSALSEKQPETVLIDSESGENKVEERTLKFDDYSSETVQSNSEPFDVSEPLKNNSPTSDVPLFPNIPIETSSAVTDETIVQMELFSPPKDGHIKPSLLKFQTVENEISITQLIANLVSFAQMTKEDAVKVTTAAVKLVKNPGTITRMATDKFAVQSTNDPHRVHLVQSNEQGTALICYGENCHNKRGKAICSHIIAVLLHFNFDYTMQFNSFKKRGRPKKLSKTNINHRIDDVVLASESLAKVGRKPSNKSTTKSNAKRKRDSLEATFINNPTELKYSRVQSSSTDEEEKNRDNKERNKNKRKEEDDSPQTNAKIIKNNKSKRQRLVDAGDSSWEYIPIGNKRGMKPKCKSCSIEIGTSEPRVAYWSRDCIKGRFTRLAPKYYCPTIPCLKKGGFRSSNSDIIQANMEMSALELQDFQQLMQCLK